jgi:hypothetical protein
MKQKWTPKELAESWTLTTEELNLLDTVIHKNRLGLALLLKFFQVEGCFPESKNEIPKACRGFVGEQIDFPIEMFEAFFKYDWVGKTSRRHRAEIRSFCVCVRFSTWLRAICSRGLMNRVERRFAARISSNKIWSAELTGKR